VGFLCLCLPATREHLGWLDPPQLPGLSQAQHPLFSAPYNGASLHMLILQMKNAKGHKIFIVHQLELEWCQPCPFLPLPVLPGCQTLVSYMTKYLAMKYSPQIYSSFSTCPPLHSCPHPCLHPIAQPRCFCCKHFQFHLPPGPEAIGSGASHIWSPFF